LLWTYCLWQEPDIGQHLQLPQLHTTDLPCFFFFTMLTMIAATIAISTAHIMIVPMFCVSQFIILFISVNKELGDRDLSALTVQEIVRTDEAEIMAPIY